MPSAARSGWRISTSWSAAIIETGFLTSPADQEVLIRHRINVLLRPDADSYVVHAALVVIPRPFPRSGNKPERSLFPGAVADHFIILVEHGPSEQLEEILIEGARGWVDVELNVVEVWLHPLHCRNFPADGNAYFRSDEELDDERLCPHRRTGA